MAMVVERQESLASVVRDVREETALNPGTLRTVRDAAFARFAARGFPTTREEEWRHTSLAPIAALTFDRVKPTTVSSDRLAEVAAVGPTVMSLWLVNGRLVGGVPGTLPAGVSVRSLSSARSDELVPVRPAGAPILVDLNTALFEDLVVIEVAPHAVVDGVISVTSVVVPGDRPTIASPRLVVCLGEAAQASLIETHAEIGSGEPVFVNAVVDVHVGPGAVLDHVKVQRQEASSFHLSSTFVWTGRAGTFTSHAITLGGRIARNDIISVLDGEGAECTLNGLYVAAGDSLVDTHTTIDHAKAHCPSHEIYRGILTDRARAVFNGKIVVRQDAQKTDAKQTNRALLLTDEAQINTKPQLEIFADDVKCTHGAAIGQLDEDALFYLKARGIGAVEARNMLLHAFAGDVLNGVKSEAVRLSAMARVEELLGLPS